MGIAASENAVQPELAISPPEAVPLYFEEVSIGQTWRSPTRLIAADDVISFAALTGDDNPLHLDAQFASDTPFHRPIVHGLLGMALAAGLCAHSPKMHTAVFLGVGGWQFLKPLYPGDTVYAETTVADKRVTGRRRGVIVWRQRLYNQQHEVVQEGTAETLVLLRSGIRPR